MPSNLVIVRGTSANFPLSVFTPQGTEAEAFDGSEALTAKLWAGADEAPIFTPAVVWVSAPDGTFKVSFGDSDTAASPFGIYYLQVYAVKAGSPSRTIALLESGSSLEILAAAGSAAPRPTYVTVADLRKIAPWIDTLQVPDSNAGFDDQCADAREWLDEIILRNYRGGNVSLLGYHGMALDAWFTGGSRRTSLTNRWIRDELAANHLMVTPRVKQVCAYYALSKICESRLTRGDAPYIAMASRFRFEAEQLLAASTFEIDTDGDGNPEVPINMSSTNTLWS